MSTYIDQDSGAVSSTGGFHGTAPEEAGSQAAPHTSHDTLTYKTFEEDPELSMAWAQVFGELSDLAEEGVVNPEDLVGLEPVSGASAPKTAGVQNAAGTRVRRSAHELLHSDRGALEGGAGPDGGQTDSGSGVSEPSFSLFDTPGSSISHMLGYQPFVPETMGTNGDIGPVTDRLQPRSSPDADLGEVTEDAAGKDQPELRQPSAMAKLIEDARIFRLSRSLPSRDSVSADEASEHDAVAVPDASPPAQQTFISGFFRALRERIGDDLLQLVDEGKLSVENYDLVREVFTEQGSPLPAYAERGREAAVPEAETLDASDASSSTPVDEDVRTRRELVFDMENAPTPEEEEAERELLNDFLAWIEKQDENEEHIAVDPDSALMNPPQMNSAPGEQTDGSVGADGGRLRPARSVSQEDEPLLDIAGDGGDLEMPSDVATQHSRAFEDAQDAQSGSRLIDALQPALALSAGDGDENEPVAWTVDETVDYLSDTMSTVLPEMDCVAPI